MEKTEALERIEWLNAMKLPCALSDWRDAVMENPNFMQEDYDHLVKYSAIPEEVLNEYFTELNKVLKPLNDAAWNKVPSRGIIYMVAHPEYQQEWNENWKKREAILETQKEERLAIEKRLHKKYLHEYSIIFKPNPYNF